jgi:hypothetical protein
VQRIENLPENIMPGWEGGGIKRGGRGKGNHLQEQVLNHSKGGDLGGDHVSNVASETFETQPTRTVQKIVAERSVGETQLSRQR